MAVEFACRSLSQDQELYIGCCRGMLAVGSPFFLFQMGSTSVGRGDSWYSRKGDDSVGAALSSWAET